MYLLKGHFLVIEDVSDQTITIHPLVYLATRKLIEGERLPSDQNDVVEERNRCDDVLVAFSKQHPNAKSDDRVWWKDSFAHLTAGYNLYNESLKVAVHRIYHLEAAFFKHKSMYTDSLKMILLAKNVVPDPASGGHLATVQAQITLLKILAKCGEISDLITKLSRGRN